MSIDPPKRRLLSLFDDPDGDARHADEMQRYREAMAAGQPYYPHPEGVGLVDALFGPRAPAESAPPPRRGVDADLALPVGSNIALPQMLAEHEQDPRDEAPAWIPPQASATDIADRPLQAGDRFAEQTATGPKLSPPAPKPPTVLLEGNKVVYVHGDGTREERDGGTRSWRNNNPGNIEAGDFADRHGAIGRAGRFAVFPTEAAGRDALNALLRTPRYQAMTLDKLVEKYAPPNENNTVAYQAFVNKQLGLPGNTAVSSLSREQMALLQKTVIRFEGWRPGNVVVGGAKP